MLKDLVSYLIETGKTHTKREVIDHPNDPDKRLVIGPDGVSTIETPRQTPRTHEICYTPEDFATCLEAERENLRNEIWFDEKSAVVFSKDAFRVHRVSIDFPPHPILDRVKALAKGEWFNQQTIVRLLRVDLAGLVDDFVLQRFRQLNWESAKRVKQTISHGSASLDAEVVQRVTSDADMPEAFIVTAPLFANVAWNHVTFPVRVAVDLDVDQCKIGLVLFPGMLDAIAQQQRVAIHGFLTSAIDDDSFELVCGKSSILGEKPNAASNN